MNIESFPYEIITLQSTTYLYQELDELIRLHPTPYRFNNRTFAKAWLTLTAPKLNCWFLDDGEQFHVYSKVSFSAFAHAQEFVHIHFK